MRMFFCYRTTPLLLALAFLSGCGKDHDASKLTKKNPLVSVVTVEAKDAPVSFAFIAQTQSSHAVNIQARVNGFLDKQVYTEGELVKEGQVLFEMDKKPFLAQLEAAEAALKKQNAAYDTAKRNLDRVKPLAEQDALSQKDLDNAVGSYLSSSASVDQAKAQLEEAQLNLSYCTITSPVTGVSSAALKQEGAYLSVGDSQLTTVAKLTPIWVNFSLSENEIQTYRDQVKKGVLRPPEKGEYEIKVIQINGELFPHTGRITFTDPYFNPQTGTFLIRASVDNPEGVLRPNQYVRVRVEGAIRPNAILVPQRAVQQSAKGYFVWVVNKDHTLSFRPVDLGDWQGENWFINEGLQSGEQVIVDGTVGLQAGQTVDIKK